MVNKKILELLEYLETTSGYVTLEELMEKYNVSRRTIFNRLKAANDYLVSEGFEEIQNTPHLGYSLKKVPGNMVKQGGNEPNLNYSLNREERLGNELWKLIKGDRVSINKLAVEFSCTRNTIIKDFKILQEENPKLQYLNTSKGKKLVSKELDIRKIILKYIQLKNTVILQKIAKLKDRHDYLGIVSRISNELNVVLTEKTIDNIAKYLKFIDYRLSEKKYITDIEYKLSEEGLSNFFVQSKKVINKLSNYNDSSDNEAELLGEVLASSQALNIEVKNRSFLEKKFEDLSQEIIFRFIQVTTSPIKLNPALLKMLKNHLYSTYFRVRFELPFYSSEINRIQKKYSKIMEYTKLACKPFEEFMGVSLSISEIALISLYLGAINYSDSIIEKPNEKIKEALKSDVLIVCSSGIGTSTILYNELSHSYPAITFSPPLEIKDLYHIRDLHGALKATLILTTTPVKETDFSLPIRKINAILSKKDKKLISETLSKYVTKLYQLSKSVAGIPEIMGVISEYAEINDYAGLREALTSLITPSKENNPFEIKKNIHIADLINLEEIIFSNEKTILGLIKEGTDILESNGVINNNYYDSIVRLIEKYGSYMHLANGVFLAHADPNMGVISPGISLVIPREEVPLDSGVNVKLVFVLAPGIHNEHVQALSEIVSIAKDSKKVNEINNMNRRNDVYQYLYFEM